MSEPTPISPWRGLAQHLRCLAEVLRAAAEHPDRAPTTAQADLALADQADQGLLLLERFDAWAGGFTEALQVRFGPGHPTDADPIHDPTRP